MTGIAYRDATVADAAVDGPARRAQLHRDLRPSLHARESRRLPRKSQRGELAGELADPRYAVRIAEEEGEAVGYAKLGPPSLPFTVEGPTAELRQLYVLKPWQGEGVAAALMDWVLAEARRRGAERSICRCSSTMSGRGASTPATASRRSGATTSWSAPMPTRTSSCGSPCERLLSHRDRRRRRRARRHGPALLRRDVRPAFPGRRHGAPSGAHVRAGRASGRAGAIPRSGCAWRRRMARPPPISSSRRWAAGAARAGRARDQAALRARAAGRAPGSRGR